MESPLEDIKSQKGYNRIQKKNPSKHSGGLITVQINDTMTEFQVGAIKTEERKETLYSQTQLYRGEGGGGSDPGFLGCATKEWCN